MTLLNAPEYNERRETRNRNLMIAGGVLVAVLAVVTVLGYLLGHGWFFQNARRRCSCGTNAQTAR
jgi:hypothetical protein